MDPGNFKRALCKMTNFFSNYTATKGKKKEEIVEKCRNTYWRNGGNEKAALYRATMPDLCREFTFPINLTRQ